MLYKSKPHKKLLLLTMLTVVSLASVVAVYAALIGTFTGSDVTIGGGASGLVEYSDDELTWSTTLSVGSATDSWYSKITIDGGQYSGTAVTMSWKLQRKTSDITWIDVGTPTTTSMTLGATTQTVYATADGSQTGNRDWGLDVSELGTYRVVVTINTA